VPSNEPKRHDRPRAVEPLDRATRERWVDLAALTLSARGETRPSAVNELLEAAAGAEPQSPVAPAYRIWAADNLAREGRYALALDAFDVAIDLASSAPRLTARADAVGAALLHKAQVARLAGDPATAIRTYRELAAATSQPAGPLYQAGWVAEADGDDDEAARLYRAAAHDGPETSRTDNPAELARRSLQRLEAVNAVYLPSARALSEVLAQALEAGDAAALERLVGTTHFAVGPAGGHTVFEKPAMFKALLGDLLDSRIQVQRQLAGSGSKRYLTSTGWKGEWYRGEVTLLLTRAPKGWQWTAVVLSEPHEAWVERWRPATPQTNQALPFALRAPWPSGQSFKAGGLTQYITEQAAVVAAGPIAGRILLATLANGPCGFGPRGSYYNQGSTHDEEDAFAIDFTRFERGVPYINASGGTPVLAVHDGIAWVNAGTASGDPDASNTVAIDHADPAVPTDTDRFRSFYLHLAGPFEILVSDGMPVITGQRLGTIDDTGNSTGSHLHFSIHDRNLPYPNVSYGRSVRPTPLSGVRLDDGDSGQCVLSDNVERFPGLNFRPSVVNFGSVAPGASRTLTVTAKNTAGSNVTISLPASSPNAVFRWAAVNEVIANGAEATFELAFHPTSNAIQRETLRITSTAPGSPHSLGLLGKGVGGIPPEPEEPPLPTALRFSPVPISFGSVAVGSSASRTLTISNATGASVAVSYPSSPAGSVFQWSAFNGPLAHNSEHRVEITFRPTSGEIARGSLTVTSATPSSPMVVGLIGKGPGGFPTPAEPEPEEPPRPTTLQFSPVPVNFGSVSIGSSASRTLTISNATGASVAVSYPSSPAGVFQWSAFNGAIANGTEHRVEITFRPASGAIARGSLTVTSATASSPTVVDLIGKGPGGF
jgi:murein DD-endopeptidase MepM/ murein hydrolase activator NlpD/tetratricopeptide (TPR) repeat protein